jgi:hypothetical protein
MDSVRFGRVLGIGARLAAKTAVAAMDAATSPNPSTGTNKVNVPTTQPTASTASATTKKRAVSSTTQIKQTGQGLKDGSRRFNEAFGSRVKRLSGALWLELTGVFFGIFALSAGIGAWKMRAALHETVTNHEEHSRLLVALLMAMVFGYFCVSSFVKANRKTRGR